MSGRALLALGCALVVLVLARALLGAGAWGGRSIAVLHACVPDGGPLGWMGIHLALVRSSAQCPAQTLALGGEPGQVAVVLATVALPVVVLHVAGLFAAAGALAALGRGISRAGALVRARVRAVLTGPVLVAAGGARRAAVLAQPRVRDGKHEALARVPARRGPPALALAA